MNPLKIFLKQNWSAKVLKPKPKTYFFFKKIL
jgi:hypothetical protein